MGLFYHFVHFLKKDHFFFIKNKLLYISLFSSYLLGNLVLLKVWYVLYNAHKRL